MQVKVFDINGKEKTKIALDDKIFGVSVNEVLLKQAFLRYQNELRKPIAKTKTRAERRGGGKKPWRQKGTGRARAGSRRSPIWRKGGVIFGPRGQENYSQKMPKKSLKKAILGALSRKARENRIIIIEDIKLKTPKTKEMKKILDNLPISGRVLFIFDKDPILYKSLENIPQVMPVLYNQLNVYDILVADFLVISQSVLSKITNIYSISSNKKVVEESEK